MELYHFLLIASVAPFIRTEYPLGWEHRWNKCYYFSPEALTWYDAESSCHAYGAELAEVDTPDEDNYFRTYSIHVDRSYWIGLRDANIEGSWMWSSGKHLTYSNWFPGEPDNIFDQDCAHYYTLYNHQWVSGVCWIGHNYICEKDYPSEVVGPAVG